MEKDIKSCDEICKCGCQEGNECTCEETCTCGCLNNESECNCSK